MFLVRKIAYVCMRERVYALMLLTVQLFYAHFYMYFMRLLFYDMRRRFWGVWDKFFFLLIFVGVLRWWWWCAYWNNKQYNVIYVSNLIKNVTPHIFIMKTIFFFFTVCVFFICLTGSFFQSWRKKKLSNHHIIKIGEHWKCVCASAYKYTSDTSTRTNAHISSHI